MKIVHARWGITTNGGPRCGASPRDDRQLTLVRDEITCMKCLAQLAMAAHTRHGNARAAMFKARAEMTKASIEATGFSKRIGALRQAKKQAAYERELRRSVKRPIVCPTDIESDK